MEIGLIVMVAGLAWIGLAILFKKRINAFYEHIPGLNQKQKQHYQKVVVKLPGVTFIVVGLYSVMVSFPQFKSLSERISWNTIVATFALSVGIFTFFIRLLKKESKFFLKYDAMIAAYGEVKGKLIHVLSYTVAPIVVGLLLLFHFIRI